MYNYLSISRLPLKVQFALVQKNKITYVTPTTSALGVFQTTMQSIRENKLDLYPLTQYRQFLNWHSRYLITEQ